MSLELSQISEVETNIISKTSLKHFTGILLQDRNFRKETIKVVCDKIISLLCRQVSPDFSVKILDDNFSVLDNGDIALSPRQAALCFLDYLRTRAFLRSYYLAIKKAQKLFPGKKIRFLDAGCGPFPLTIPLATQFEDENIEFILWDIHQNSLNCANSIIDKLDLRRLFPYIDTPHDATKDVFGGDPFHILGVETMSSGLLREPQLPITANLVPFMEKDGILIPEKIIIYIYLSNSGGFVKELGKVFNLNKELALKISRVMGNVNTKRFRVDKNFEIDTSLDCVNEIILGTRVNVFQDIVLDRDDLTSISFPICLVNEINYYCYNPNLININYRFGASERSIKITLRSSDSGKVFVIHPPENFVHI